MKITKQPFFVFIFIVFLLFHCVLYLLDYEVAMEFVSPDSTYRLRVYRRPMMVCMMPGSGSDAPGLIVLQRLMDKKIIFWSTIGMIQEVDPYNVRWTEKEVQLEGDIRAITYSGERKGYW